MRLVEAAGSLASGGVKVFAMELSPAALGLATVVLTRTLDALKVEFRVARPEARESLEREVETLREALIAAGHPTVQIEVKPHFQITRSDDGSLREEASREHQEQASQDDGNSRQRQRDVAHYERRFVSRSLGYNSFEIAA